MNKTNSKRLLILVLIVIGYIYRGSLEITTSTTDISKKKPGTTSKPLKTKTTTIASSSATYLVDHVVDGDTFSVVIDGKKETIRLIGIDTPEVVDPRKPVQCYGREASDKAKEFLTGKNVVLTNDPTQGERDKYKRLLRYAFLEDGTNFNEYMIREGYAHEYTYQSNPYQFQSQFKAAEIYSRENKKGLWADGICN